METSGSPENNGYFAGIGGRPAGGSNPKIATSPRTPMVDGGREETHAAC